MKLLLIAAVVAATHILSSFGSPEPSGDKVKINGGEFKDFNGFKFPRSGDLTVIKGGEFRNFGDIKGRKKRDAGEPDELYASRFRRYGDKTEIKGGEFHTFGDIKGRKKRETETELSRWVRRCRINGGDFSGLSASEKAKLKANCKVVGGDFGDKRSVRRVSEEDLQDADFKIEGGKYEGQGKGIGSLSDITGTKNHLIKNGLFSYFGDIKG